MYVVTKFNSTFNHCIVIIVQPVQNAVESVVIPNSLSLETRAVLQKE